MIPYQEQLDNIVDAVKNILKSFEEEHTYKVGDFAVRPVLATHWEQGKAFHLGNEILYKGAVVERFTNFDITSQKDAELYIKSFYSKNKRIVNYEDSLKTFKKRICQYKEELKEEIENLEDEYQSKIRDAKSDLTDATTIFKGEFGVPEYNDNGELEGYQYEGKFYKYSKVIETIEELDKFLEYVVYGPLKNGKLGAFSKELIEDTVKSLYEALNED